MSTQKKSFQILVRLLLVPIAVILTVVLTIKSASCIRGLFTESRSAANTKTDIHLPRGYSVHGIDVSRHQGTVNWKQVTEATLGDSQKISFVFIKATEGSTRKDENFKTNWENAGSFGLVRGAYHFFHPSRDAREQAASFIHTVHLRTGDMPPVADIEHTNGKSVAEIRKSLQTFLDALEKHYGVKPIIYTNIHFYNNYLQDSFSQYPLWISCYYDHERFYNTFPEPWLFWQHSESGRIAGIRGKTDFNVFYGSKKEFLKICISEH